MTWRYMLALCGVALIAFLDEFHQSFYSSRSGSLLDVLLDFSGGLAAVLMIWLWDKRVKSAN